MEPSYPTDDSIPSHSLPNMLFALLSVINGCLRRLLVISDNMNHLCCHPVLLDHMVALARPANMSGKSN